MQITFDFQQYGQKPKATRRDVVGQLEKRSNFILFSVVMRCRVFRRDSVADSAQYSAYVCDLAEVLTLFDQYVAHDPSNRWRRIPAFSMTRLGQVFLGKRGQYFQCPRPDGIEVSQYIV